jgi:hypothetical protein
LTITNHYKEKDNLLDWVYVKGNIKNTGLESKSGVTVNVIFYDGDNDIIETSTDYIGSLYAGEEESFEVYEDEDYLPAKVDSYEIEIDYW